MTCGLVDGSKRFVFSGRVIIGSSWMLASNVVRVTIISLIIPKRKGDSIQQQSLFRFH